MTTSAELPLSGIRVIDHGHVWAGPLLGMSLADMGAEVIKIQSPSGSSGVSIAGKNSSALTSQQTESSDRINYHTLDRGKKSLTLDLKTVDGKNIYKSLIKLTDVVIENFSYGTMESLGFDYRVLKEINPKIIVASLSAAGSSPGPWSELVSYGPSISALYGVKSLLGYHDSDQPVEDPADLDPTAAGHAFIAVLAALEMRDKTGIGQHIDMSQGESGIQRIAEPVMDFFFNGRVASTQGNRYPGIVPHGYFKTFGEDQWISLTIRDDKEWSRFRKDFSGEIPEIDQDVLDNLDGRTENQDYLESMIEHWTQSQDAWTLTNRLQGIGIPAYPVMDYPGLVGDDNLNHLHRNHVEINNEELDRNELYKGIMWKLSTSNGAISTPAPSLGQDNKHILRNLLKYSDNEVDNFKRRGII